MQRRTFISLIGGAAVLPFGVRAQAVLRVGFLRSTSRHPFESLDTALRQGLKEAGFVEGQGFEIEARYADNDLDRLPALTAELIRRPVAVIVTNSLGASVAKAATSAVPIVFVSGNDPVQHGLVPNLNRPGGNITGIAFLGGVVGTKRLALVRQFVPKAALIAVLVHPNTAETETERTELLAAAQSVRQQLVVFDVRNGEDIDRAFDAATQRGVGAVLIGVGAFLNSQRERLAALASRHALPAIHFQREFAELGGLMSYGTDQPDAYRQAGVYAGRILKGEKPGDLPVAQAAKFALVLNLKTAKTLGLEFHPQLLATADEVIE